MPRTASPVGLSTSEREKLELIAGRPKSPQRDAMRARIVLLCAKGKTNVEVAALTGTCVQTLGKWRERFAADRLAGLTDAPRTISDKTVEEVLTKTLEGVPGHLTHWSQRKMARETGIGQTSVGRIWRAFGVKPHVVRGFKLSKDPMFTEKVRDVVGLYSTRPRTPSCCRWMRKASARP